MRCPSKLWGDIIMAQKRRPHTSIVKQLSIAGMVVCVVWLGFWAATGGFNSPNLLFLTPIAVGVFAMTFWAFGEQFMFSFGKSRHLTRTEKKRLRHQRKKSDD